MNAFISKALHMVATINANNAIAGIDTFIDCGLDFDLLYAHEEAMYESKLGECLARGFDESFRLNTLVLDRAIAVLDERM